METTRNKVLRIYEDRCEISENSRKIWDFIDKKFQEIMKKASIKYFQEISIIFERAEAENVKCYIALNNLTEEIESMSYTFEDVLGARILADVNGIPYKVRGGLAPPQIEFLFKI